MQDHEVQQRLVDGDKALRKSIVQTLGACAPVQRCQEHKRRNVQEHLPDELHASAKRALQEAWSASRADRTHRHFGTGRWIDDRRRSPQRRP